MFFISLGYYSRPKINWKQCLCKIWGGGAQIRCVMWKMWKWRMNAFNTQRLVIEFPESTPWREKEMRDLSGLLGFGALWRIGTLFFDAGEVFELRLHIVIFLASHYVGKQHRTMKRKTVKSGHELSIGYTEKAGTNPSLRKWILFLYLCLYFYVLTTTLNFSKKVYKETILQLWT